MKNITSYFIEHDLFTESKLIDHCERNLVRISKTVKYPHLRILHYLEEAHREKTWTNFSRRCRGLIVDLKNKKILAYPFEKFFNMDEMPETSYNTLKEKGAFEASEKLDGSMGIFYFDKELGEFRIATKGSLDSEQAQWANQNIPALICSQRLVENYTLVFEIISNRHRIVIDYRKKGYPEGLYLVGVRHLKSENMLPYKEVVAFAKEYDLKVTNTYEFNTLDEIIDSIKGMDYNSEGYVLNFDGLRVKIKSMDYLKVHRFLSRLSGKNILEALIVGEEKDIVDLAPEEYIEEIKKTVLGYKNRALADIESLCTLFASAPKETRKEFAIWVMSTVDPMKKAFMFSLFDGKLLDFKTMYSSYLKNKQWDDSMDSFMSSKFHDEKIVEENIHG